jgi:3-deoxy-manno-octulosonate cytidylyltransferase (CMP-KDO synthetase)
MTDLPASVLIVVPARYASTRYPGKPLVALRGSTGISKTLIRRSWDSAMAVVGIDRVVVATDDDKIANESKSFGAEVVMTSEDCANGTERCSDALDRLAENYDIIVNLQGDAPLTPNWFVEDLVKALKSNPNANVATPVLRCDADALNGFLEDRHNGRVGGTTAVFDRAMRALYFSKEVIPYTNKAYSGDDIVPVFHHVGVYAYRAKALKEYVGWTSGPLETLEGLEQLRFMENGEPVLCVEVDGKGRSFWELNNPEDVARIESKLAEMGVE